MVGPNSQLYVLAQFGSQIEHKFINETNGYVHKPHKDCNVAHFGKAVRVDFFWLLDFHEL